MLKRAYPSTNTENYSLQEATPPSSPNNDRVCPPLPRREPIEAKRLKAEDRHQGAHALYKRQKALASVADRQPS